MAENRSVRVPATCSIHEVNRLVGVGRTRAGVIATIVLFVCGAVAVALVTRAKVPMPQALLALAQGQRGIDRRELVDLAVVTSTVLDRFELEAMTRSIEVEPELSPARLSGDRRLIERLVSNLLQNALRHNDDGLVLPERINKLDGTIAPYR